MPNIKIRNLIPATGGDITSGNFIASALNTGEGHERVTRKVTYEQVVSGGAVFADFSEGLNVSGNPVITGFRTPAPDGGLAISGSNDILYIGSVEDDDNREVHIQYQGEDSIIIDSNNDVKIEKNLLVQDGEIRGKVGKFSEDLLVDGKKVLISTPAPGGGIGFGGGAGDDDPVAFTQNGQTRIKLESDGTISFNNVSNFKAGASFDPYITLGVQTDAPSSLTNKLYNKSGNLWWEGWQIAPAVDMTNGFSPEEDNTGNVGTSTNAWANGNFHNLEVKSTAKIEAIEATNMIVTEKVEYSAGAISYLGESQLTPSDQGRPFRSFKSVNDDEIYIIDSAGSLSTTIDGFSFNRKKTKGINSKIIALAIFKLPNTRKRIFAKMDAAAIPGTIEISSASLLHPEGTGPGMYSDDNGNTWIKSNFKPSWSYLIGDPYTGFNSSSSSTGTGSLALTDTGVEYLNNASSNTGNPFRSFGHIGGTTNTSWTNMRISIKTLADSENGPDKEASRRFKALILGQADISSTDVEGNDVLINSHTFGGSNAANITAEQLDMIPFHLPDWATEEGAELMYLSKPTGSFAHSYDMSTYYNYDLDFMGITLRPRVSHYNKSYQPVSPWHGFVGSFIMRGYRALDNLLNSGQEITLQFIQDNNIQFSLLGTFYGASAYQLANDTHWKSFHYDYYPTADYAEGKIPNGYSESIAYRISSLFTRTSDDDMANTSYLFSNNNYIMRSAITCPVEIFLPDGSYPDFNHFKGPKFKLGTFVGSDYYASIWRTLISPWVRWTINWRGYSGTEDYFASNPFDFVSGRSSHSLANVIKHSDTEALITDSQGYHYLFNVKSYGDKLLELYNDHKNTDYLSTIITTKEAQDMKRDMIADTTSEYRNKLIVNSIETDASLSKHPQEDYRSRLLSFVTGSNGYHINVMAKGKSTAKNLGITEYESISKVWSTTIANGLAVPAFVDLYQFQVSNNIIARFPSDLGTRQWSSASILIDSIGQYTAVEANSSLTGAETSVRYRTPYMHTNHLTGDYLSKGSFSHPFSHNNEPRVFPLYNWYNSTHGDSYFYMENSDGKTFISYRSRNIYFDIGTSKLNNGAAYNAKVYSSSIKRPNDAGENIGDFSLSLFEPVYDTSYFHNFRTYRHSTGNCSEMQVKNSSGQSRWLVSYHSYTRDISNNRYRYLNDRKRSEYFYKMSFVQSFEKGEDIARQASGSNLSAKQFVAQIGMDYPGSIGQRRHACEAYISSENTTMSTNSIEADSFQMNTIRFYQDTFSDASKTALNYSGVGSAYDNDSATRYIDTNDEISYTLEDNDEYLARFYDKYKDSGYILPVGNFYANTHTIYFTAFDEGSFLNFQNATFEIYALNLNGINGAYGVQGGQGFPGELSDMTKILTLDAEDIESLSGFSTEANGTGVRITISPGMFGNDIDTMMQDLNIDPYNTEELNEKTMNCYHLILVARDISSQDYLFKRLFARNHTYADWTTSRVLGYQLTNWPRGNTRNMHFFQNGYVKKEAHNVYTGTEHIIRRNQIYQIDGPGYPVLSNCAHLRPTVGDFRLTHIDLRPYDLYNDDDVLDKCYRNEYGLGGPYLNLKTAIERVGGTWDSNGPKDINGDPMTADCFVDNSKENSVEYQGILSRHQSMFLLGDGFFAATKRKRTIDRQSVYDSIDATRYYIIESCEHTISSQKVSGFKNVRYIEPLEDVADDTWYFAYFSFRRLKDNLYGIDRAKKKIFVIPFADAKNIISNRNLKKDDFTELDGASTGLILQSDVAYNEGTEEYLLFGESGLISKSLNGVDSWEVKIEPQYSFASDRNTGFYKDSDAALHLVRFGKKILSVTDDGVYINDTFSAQDKQFKIDHPLAELSKNYYLRHASVESPQSDLIYRGFVSFSGQTHQVNLDDYFLMTRGTFEALCTNIQTFSSNESSFNNVKSKVIGNILHIELENESNSPTTVSWMVVGERKDKFIMESKCTDENGRLITEIKKLSHYNAEVSAFNTDFNNLDPEKDISMLDDQSDFSPESEKDLDDGVIEID